MGHTVVGVDNLVGGHLRNVHQDVEFHHEDCNNLESMKKCIKGCDVVFHAACTAHDGLSAFSPWYVTNNTFQNTMSVLSASIYNNIKRFVFCSSMSRYGKQDNIPFDEEMVCKPRVPYAIAKYSSEQIIKQLSTLNGMEYVIIVPHNIIGPRQKYDDPYRNVAAIMINRMLQKKQPVIYGDGNQKRCFSFIDDVIFCLEKAIFQENVIGEVINVGPDEEFVTINTLAKTIAEILDFNLHPIYVKGRPFEVKYATCSANKARRLLGYRTSTTLKQGLSSMVESISQYGPEPFNYEVIDLEIKNEHTPSTWVNKLI